MAMNKAERARFEELEAQLELQRALRFRDDLIARRFEAPPKFSEYLECWSPGSLSNPGRRIWFNGSYFSEGDNPPDSRHASRSQYRGDRFYVTRKDALIALRKMVADDAAKALRRLDKLIDAEIANISDGQA